MSWHDVRLIKIDWENIMFYTFAATKYTTLQPRGHWTSIENVPALVLLLLLLPYHHMYSRPTRIAFNPTSYDPVWGTLKSISNAWSQYSFLDLDRAMDGKWYLAGLRMDATLTQNTIGLWKWHRFNNNLSFVIMIIIIVIIILTIIDIKSKG